MLLSEVLEFAKELKHINEAYKSQKLSDIFKKFDYSSLTLKPVYIDSTKASWRSASPLDTWDVKYQYKDLAVHNLLTQELLDDPKKRDEHFNIKYVKKKPNSYDRPFIEELLSFIRSKTGYNIGISEIEDSHLEQISIEDAKKKPYKSRLQFWMGFDNELKAVCKDNIIITYIVKEGTWLENNHDYKGPTNMGLFNKNIYNYEDDELIVKEFIKKAFKEIPVYKVYFSPKEIKDILGANNIKTLQNKSDVFRVFAVNAEGMEKSDYNEIAKNRLDYRQYLNSQMDLAQKNFNRYKNEIKLRKEQGIDSKVLITVDNAYNIIFDIYSDLQTFMMPFISNISKYKFEYTPYSESIQYNYKYQNLINIVPDNIHKYHAGSKRNGYDVYEYYFYNIGDAFIILNTYLEYLLKTLEELTNIIDKINKLKQDTKQNKDYILSYIDNLKTSYVNFFKLLNYDNDNVMEKALYLLDSVKIDPKPILNKLKNIKAEF